MRLILKLALICLAAELLWAAKCKKKLRLPPKIRSFSRTCSGRLCPNHMKAMEATVNFQKKVADRLNKEHCKANELEETMEDHEKRITKLEKGGSAGKTTKKNKQDLSKNNKTLNTLREEVDVLTPKLSDIQKELKKAVESLKSQNETLEDNKEDIEGLKKTTEKHERKLKRYKKAVKSSQRSIRKMDRKIHVLTVFSRGLPGAPPLPGFPIIPNHYRNGRKNSLRVLSMPHRISLLD